VEVDMAVSILSLWLPIVVSAVIVFVVSSIIHMATPFHRGDLKTLPREDDVMSALRPFGVPPGNYAMPHAGSMEAMRSPAFLEKMRKGPVAFITVRPPGETNMGPMLITWFLYSVVISFLAAYIAGATLERGSEYLKVFQIAGCVAFIGYAGALPQMSIWWSRSWATTIRTMVDGLIYGLMTGGTFGWLWPR
jgi:hypothetical protein